MNIKALREIAMKQTMKSRNKYVTNKLLTMLEHSNSGVAALNFLRTLKDSTIEAENFLFSFNFVSACNEDIEDLQAEIDRILYAIDYAPNSTSYVIVNTGKLETKQSFISRVINFLRGR